MNIKQIYKENKKGFTLKVGQGVSLDKSKEGYFVSITDNKIELDNLDSEFRKLLKLGNLLNLERFYIGYWEGHLDISVKCYSLLKALIMAKHFNQEAIYDNENEESIEVN